MTVVRLEFVVRLVFARSKRRGPEVGGGHVSAAARGLRAEERVVRAERGGGVGRGAGWPKACAASSLGGALLSTWATPVTGEGELRASLWGCPILSEMQL